MRLTARSLLVVCLALAMPAPPTARAEDPPAVGDEEPDGAEPERALEFVNATTIRKPDGMEIRFHRVNAVDPKLVIDELTKWKTKPATVVLMGAPVKFRKESDHNRVPVDKTTVLAQTTLRIEEHVDNWPILEKVLAMIDVPPPQVHVEAKIVEITLDDQLRIGIESSNVRTDRPVGDLFFKRFDAVFANQIGVDVASTLALGSADKFVKFDYVLQLGASGAKAEVLSMPSIVASIGEVATINVGEREPIVTQTLSGTNVVAATKFEDLGLTLRVMPLQIGRDVVRASIEPEVSRVSEFRITSTSTERDVINPVISTRNAKTVVMIPDGETVVISGLQQTQKLSERKGIPLLKDIPLIGSLFGSTTEREQKTELVIFVTFTILHPGEGRLILPPAELDRVAAPKSE